MAEQASSFVHSLKTLIRNFGKAIQNKTSLTQSKSSNKVIRIIVEEHEDGFVGYPLGLKGVVVGQGETKKEALEDTISAIKFHIETFGPQVLEDDSPVINAFMTEVKSPELALR